MKQYLLLISHLSLSRYEVSKAYTLSRLSIGSARVGSIEVLEWYKKRLSSKRWRHNSAFSTLQQIFKLTSEYEFAKIRIWNMLTLKPSKYALADSQVPAILSIHNYMQKISSLVSFIIRQKIQLWRSTFKSYKLKLISHWGIQPYSTRYFILDQLGTGSLV